MREAIAEATKQGNPSNAVDSLTGKQRKQPGRGAPSFTSTSGNGMKSIRLL
jgi:hypothetical protein